MNAPKLHAMHAMHALHALHAMHELQVALYARVSSEQQAEAKTIASQLAELQTRITADGVAWATVLSFVDEGYSGAERPWSDPRWSACAMWPLLVAWIASLCTVPIGERATMRTRPCSWRN